MLVHVGATCARVCGFASVCVCVSVHAYTCPLSKAMPIMATSNTKELVQTIAPQITLDAYFPTNVRMLTHRHTYIHMRVASRNRTLAHKDDFHLFMDLGCYISC